MKVALVHDWLIHMRGGEKVLESLAELFPDATIYTLFSNRAELSPSLARMKIKNSVLHYFPGIRKYYRWLLPFLPFFIRTLRVTGADVVISCSHCVAKGIRRPANAIHICYCLTPMRYLWGFEQEYFGNFPPWLRFCLQPVFDWLRRWDCDANRHVDIFFCISEYVKERIRKIYGREALVIYPPVNIDRYGSSSLSVKKEDYYLVVSALTPYKRVDLAIEAFKNDSRRLIVAGDGPLKRHLRNLSGSSNIRFLGKVTDDVLKRLYQEAKAVIFPQEEDFGIVPLEAQASGTPVIAYGRGGVLETVKEGVFFYEQTPEALRRAILRFETLSIRPEKLRQQALQFDKKAFQHKINQAIKNVIH